jgi:hypothetical protein
MPKKERQLPKIFAELIVAMTAELIGKAYGSLKLRTCYLIIGGLTHKSTIDLPGVHTDTRQPFLIAIEPGFGKSTILQFVYWILDGIAVVRRPSSLWPEQLIGTTVLRKVKGSDVTTPKPGYFKDPFILVDEASRWLRRSDRIAQDLWAMIRLAHDAYGRNWIEKELTAVLPKEVLRYLAECVMMIFQQPTLVLYDYIEDGTLRRLLPSVHDIPVVDKEHIVRQRGRPRSLEVKGIENIKATFSLLSLLSFHWAYSDQAIRAISEKTLSIIRQAEGHRSAVVRSYVKYMHTTIQNRLYGMAAILAASEYIRGKKKEDFRFSNGSEAEESYKFEAYVNVTSKHVGVAADHLRLFLEETYDFLERLVRSSSIFAASSPRWLRALGILKLWNCTSEEASSRSIKEYISEIARVLECSEGNAKRIYNALKKDKLIASRQLGSYGSKVWLTAQGLRVLETEARGSESVPHPS